MMLIEALAETSIVETVEPALDRDLLTVIGITALLDETAVKMERRIRMPIAIGTAARKSVAVDVAEIQRIAAKVPSLTKMSVIVERSLCNNLLLD
jgi:hypothetical protein